MVRTELTAPVFLGLVRELELPVRRRMNRDDVRRLLVVASALTPVVLRPVSDVGSVDRDFGDCMKPRCGPWTGRAAVRFSVDAADVPEGFGKGRLSGLVPFRCVDGDRHDGLLNREDLSERYQAECRFRPMQKNIWMLPEDPGKDEGEQEHKLFDQKKRRVPHS